MTFDRTAPPATTPQAAATTPIVVAPGRNVPLHHTVHKPEPPLRLGKTIEQQILQTVSGSFDEKVVRSKFVQMALTVDGAVGAGYLIKDESDRWTIAIDKPAVGRLPDRRAFDDPFNARCDTFAANTSVQLEPIVSLEGLTGLFAPIASRNGQAELMLVVVKSTQAATLGTTVIQKMAAALQLWLNGRSAANVEWEVQALSALIELIGKIENQPDQTKAAEECVNVLADHWRCSSVAIGLWDRSNLKLQAISSVPKLVHGTETSYQYLQTLIESSTRDEPAIFPAFDAENNFLLQAHKQLAACLHAESVFSQPLKTADGAKFGALVFVGPSAILESNQFARFQQTAAPNIANSMRLVGQLKQGLVAKTVRLIRTKNSVAKRLFALVVLVGVGLLMTAPITYRVRCNCVTEPVSRRFAVAPFDGQIVTGYVEAGDTVTAGQTLAEMDGRTLRWELSSVVAEREQSLRTREMELSDRNVPKTILAELEHDRLSSQEDILEFKRDHLLIKSPIDGIVLTGSLERAEAASITTGQVLFEIGPMQPMRIEIAIPDDEIAQIKQGNAAKVWINGQEGSPIEGRLKKINPRSETRDAKNVFIAEIEFANADQRLRPGMQGTVRIDCEKRSLGWSLFHKPWNYMQARLTWW